MAAFTGHSAEPCYTPRPDRNYELRLLMEKFARDTKRCSKMDLCTQAYHEKEEILLSIKKSLDDLEKSYAQPAQDHPSVTILEEEEEDEGYEDIVEHTEVVTESSRDDHDKKCLVLADHTFPHPTLSFEEAGMSERCKMISSKKFLGDFPSNPCWKKKSKKGCIKKLWRMKKVK
ncbi:unnamed protein product [Linum trigynum]|uniref:Uncharacterized protein n=1 Tax=Linum trigynum TaxID=586398 RepID=A0AAV2GPF0_9ROSI